MKFSDAIGNEPVVHVDSGDLWCRSHFCRNCSAQSGVAVCYHDEKSSSCRWSWQRTKNVNCNKFYHATAKEEFEMTFVRIGLTISSPSHACLSASLLVFGHMLSLICPSFGVVHPSTSKMSSHHPVVVAIKHCSAQSSGTDFQKQAIDDGSSY